MTARTHTGFGAPFIEIDAYGDKIPHTGDPFPEGVPAKGGGVAVDLLPLLTQEAEDKMLRLNALGFSVVSDVSGRGQARFYINDEELEETFAEAALPYTPDWRQNLRNFEAWLDTVDPDALREQQVLSSELAQRLSEW